MLSVPRPWRGWMGTFHPGRALRLAAFRHPAALSDESRGVRSGLIGVAIAAQVREDDRVVLSERGGNVAPDEMVLRITVQQQQRRARPFDGTPDGDALDVNAPVLKAGQQHRGGRGGVFLADSRHGGFLPRGSWHGRRPRSGDRVSAGLRCSWYWLQRPAPGGSVEPVRIPGR